jgi:hypothetical protein
MSLGDGAKFKYLGITVSDGNCMQEEFKGRLTSGSACYHSVKSLSPFRLLSRNVKVKIFILAGGGGVRKSINVFPCSLLGF